ncbi:hypothetical protein WDU94_015309 [Cyamophila willieti]
MHLPPELKLKKFPGTTTLGHIDIADLCLVLTFLSIFFSLIFYLLKSFQRLEREKEIFLQTSLTCCLNSFEVQQKLFAEKVQEIVKLCSNKHRILNRKTEFYRYLIEFLIRDLVRSGFQKSDKRQTNRHVTFNPLIDIRYISTTGLAKKTRSLSAMRSSMKVNRLRRKRTKNSLISPSPPQPKEMTTKQHVIKATKEKRAEE